MKFYENIEAERDRIQACINKFGHTSDHNLDWWFCSAISPDRLPVFIEWSDGSGLLAHHSKNEWRIWSDPVSVEEDMAGRIEEFSLEIFKDKDIKVFWCDDVSDSIYPKLKNLLSPVFELSPRRDIEYPDQRENFLTYYRLFWPVLEMSKYNSSLPGGHFKRIRNARSKFYREHDVKVLKTSDLNQGELLKIVDDWKTVVSKKQKEDVRDLRYRLTIENGFRGFVTARAMIVDGRPVGINAGYEVPNHTGRFTSVIGMHDYSVKDLGVALYLEDLDWVKNAGYKEFDLQGTEYEWEVRVKTQYGAVIERKTDTFSIIKK